MKRETRIQKAIKRIKFEKDQTEKYYFDLGKGDGFNWSLDAQYKEIVAMLSWDGTFPEDDFIFAILEDAIARDDFMDFNHNIYTDATFNAFTDKYFIGFVEGIQELWDMVSEKP